MITTEQLQTLAQLYNSGLSREQIARKTGIPESSVGYLLKKTGIKMRPKGFQKGNNVGVKFKAKEPYIFNCLECRVETKTTPCKSPENSDIPQLYCSRECYHKARGKQMRAENHPMWKGGFPKCKECGTKLSARNLKTNLCQICYPKTKTGKNHWNYKHGNSKQWRREYNYPKYRSWRKQVLSRDNYICQHCGSNKELHAHHIIEWAKSKELRYDINNGLTLCRNCHEKHHNFKFTGFDKGRHR